MDFVIEDGILIRYNGSDEHVVIPDGVTEIGERAFAENTTLRSVVIPNSVTEIGKEAFNACTALESVEIPDSVTDVGSGAFYECRALKKVRLSKNMTEISDRCFMETAIDSIELHEGIDCIGNGAFASCHNLKSVTVPDSVEEIDVFAFGYDSNWDEKSDRIEGFVLRGSIDSPARFYAHEYDLTFVPVGDVRELPEFEIEDGVLVCYNGSSDIVRIPREVTVIGKYAFKANKNLKHVFFHNGVTEIGFHSFEDCVNLKEADIPGSVKEIVAYAFMRCKSLSKVKLHEGLLKIGTWAFGDCESLHEITIPRSVRKIDHYALGFKESSYQDIYTHGIPHRFCCGLKINTNNSNAAYEYLAWHRLTWRGPW